MSTDNTLLLLRSKMSNKPSEPVKNKSFNKCVANLSRACSNDRDIHNFVGNLCNNCYHMKQIILSRKKSGKPSIILHNNYTKDQAFEFLNILDPYQILKLSGLFSLEQEQKINRIFKPENIELYEKELIPNNIKNTEYFNNETKSEYEYKHQYSKDLIEHKYHSIISITESKDPINSTISPTLKI